MVGTPMRFVVLFALTCAIGGTVWALLEAVQTFQTIRIPSSGTELPDLPVEAEAAVSPESGELDIDFALTSVDGSPARADHLAVLTFTLTDSLTDAPVLGRAPLAWISSNVSGEPLDETTCARHLEALTSTSKEALEQPVSELGPWLREIAGGVYTAMLKPNAAGMYDVALRIESPPTYACFYVEVEEDEQEVPSYEVRFIDPVDRRGSSAAIAKDRDASHPPPGRSAR